MGILNCDENGNPRDLPDTQNTKKLSIKQQLKIKDETIEIITLANAEMADECDKLKDKLVAIRDLCETMGHRKLKVTILDIIAGKP